MKIAFEVTKTLGRLAAGCVAGALLGGAVAWGAIDRLETNGHEQALSSLSEYLSGQKYSAGLSCDAVGMSNFTLEMTPAECEARTESAALPQAAECELGENGMTYVRMCVETIVPKR